MGNTGNSNSFRLFRSFDRNFLVLFSVAYLMIGLYTIPDYGLTWDESWENYYGDKTLNYFFSFDADHLDFEEKSVDIYNKPDHPDWHWSTNVYRDNDLLHAPHLIWPLGPVLSSITKYIFYDFLKLFGAIDSHHLAPLLAMLILAIFTYRFVRSFCGRVSAVAATLILATYPRLWAHAHFNSKDVICAMFFGLTIYAFHAGIIRRQPWYFVLSAVLWGFGLATKANTFFLAFILIPYFVVAMLHRRRLHLWGKRDPLPGRKTWVMLGLYPVIGIAVMLLCWPYLWQDFPSRIGLYIESLGSRGFSGESGWNTISLNYAFATMPVAVIIGLGLGLSAMFRLRKYPHVTTLVLLWLVVPVLRVCLPGAKDFDGIRHWLEFVPALAIVAGLGFGSLYTVIGNRLMALPMRRVAVDTIGAALVLLVLTPVIMWNVDTQPNQIAYFNPIKGRLPGAREAGYPEAGDYWGNSYRQGFEWLSDNVAEQHPRLVVGVAEHIAYSSYQVWLDKRIKLTPQDKLTHDAIQAVQRPVYLMYIVRPGWYSPIVKYYDKVPPVHTVSVDGAPILIIKRIR